MMNSVVLEATNLTKNYDSFRALDSVSFVLRRGEVLGLLGPNGAGKTTTLRMLVDITRPDEGEVRLLGQPIEQMKDRIAYLPEERGLYPKGRVLETLVYFAELKGVPRKVAEPKAKTWLERMGLGQHVRSRAEQLSKGMQQKVQLIGAMLHDPEVLLLDEPFSGLDPLNTQLIEDVMKELRQQGKALLLSTHLMHQAEDLCDRVVMLNRGRLVLEGTVPEVRQRFSDQSLFVEIVGALNGLNGVAETKPSEGGYRLFLKPNVAPQMVLAELVHQNVTVQRFEIYTPPLEEIFIKVASESMSQLTS
jgi:ABC-2 type transport system ATP-binding protein